MGVKSPPRVAVWCVSVTWVVLRHGGSVLVRFDEPWWIMAWRSWSVAVRPGWEGSVTAVMDWFGTLHFVAVRLAMAVLVGFAQERYGQSWCGGRGVVRYVELSCGMARRSRSGWFWNVKLRRV